MAAAIVAAAAVQVPGQYERPPGGAQHVEGDHAQLGGLDQGGGQQRVAVGRRCAAAPARPTGRPGRPRTGRCPAAARRARRGRSDDPPDRGSTTVPGPARSAAGPPSSLAPTRDGSRRRSSQTSARCAQACSGGAATNSSAACVGVQARDARRDAARSDAASSPAAATHLQVQRGRCSSVSSSLANRRSSRMPRPPDLRTAGGRAAGEFEQPAHPAERDQRLAGGRAVDRPDPRPDQLLRRWLRLDGHPAAAAPRTADADLERHGDRVRSARSNSPASSSSPTPVRHRSARRTGADRRAGDQPVEDRPGGRGQTGAVPAAIVAGSRPAGVPRPAGYGAEHVGGSAGRCHPPVSDPRNQTRGPPARPMSRGRSSARCAGRPAEEGRSRPPDSLVSVER